MISKELKQKFKDSIAEYRRNRTVENFNKVLDCRAEIEDASVENDVDYVITTGSEASLGIRVPKDQGDRVPEILEEEQDMEIKGNDEDGNIILGYKGASVDAIEDSKKYKVENVTRQDGSVIQVVVVEREWIDNADQVANDLANKNPNLIISSSDDKRITLEDPNLEPGKPLQIKDGVFEKDYEIISTTNQNGQVEQVVRINKEWNDKSQEILEYLYKKNPNLRIVSETDTEILLNDPELEEGQPLIIKDSEEYNLEKVNNDKYNVLKNGEQKYELTKTHSGKWECTCPGFTYRGKCKHTSMLEDTLPKRRPKEELDNLMPEIREIFNQFGTEYNEETREGNWAVVGSYRRGKFTWKDIDILIECDTDTFKKVEEILQEDPNYKRTMSGSSIIRGNYHGYDFDVTRVTPGEWGSFLLYRTGSAQFNMHMRAIAKKLGYRLNEHGLFDSDGNRIAYATEEDIFNALGINYVKPQNREL